MPMEYKEIHIPMQVFFVKSRSYQSWEQMKKYLFRLIIAIVINDDTQEIVHMDATVSHSPGTWLKKSSPSSLAEIKEYYSNKTIFIQAKT